MMTQSRSRDENMILDHYLGPKAYAFGGTGTSSPYLKAAVKTNNGKVYVLYYDLSTFPTTKPKVYVTQMLYTKSGEPMNSPNGVNHTLSSWNNWTQLCHYSDTQWTPDITLWHVYLKCRVWLEIYQTHLRTGKTMESMLKHQTSHV